MAPRLALEWLRDDLLAQDSPTLFQQGATVVVRAYEHIRPKSDGKLRGLSGLRIPVSFNGGWDRWRPLANLFSNWWTRQFVPNPCGRFLALLLLLCSSARRCSDPVRTGRAIASQRIRLRRLALCLWPVAHVALHKHRPACIMPRAL